jgi:hypothetical protein
MSNSQLCARCGAPTGSKQREDGQAEYCNACNEALEQFFAEFDVCFDGLRLCSVCGDVETQDDVCHRCRQQEWIDKHG